MFIMREFMSDCGDNLDSYHYELYENETDIPAGTGYVTLNIIDNHYMGCYKRSRGYEARRTYLNKMFNDNISSYKIKPRG